MNIGNIRLELEFEKAIGFLCKHVPLGVERKKPLLMHAMRVGMFLYERGSSREIVLGGLLHDILEWTNGSEDELREQFGDRVCEIVKANTKNRAIDDPAVWRGEYIDRCIAFGEDATVVKAADALDSYHFYVAINNPEEIQRSVDIAKTILKKRPPNYHDPIFDELEHVTST